MDLKLWLSLADAESEDMPMIIEHLDNDEAYLSSIRYVLDSYK